MSYYLCSSSLRHCGVVLRQPCTVHAIPTVVMPLTNTVRSTVCFANTDGCAMMADGRWNTRSRQRGDVVFRAGFQNIDFCIWQDKE
jgi:hypothetical protein